ncbi:DUF11 domain-containing protein [Candidatus Sumerlaeota bacterium]|nr:DUF11 domain-containing protein [Candidatus Sumerlaeota bacterium]
MAKAVVKWLNLCVMATLPVMVGAQQASPSADLQVTKSDGTVLVAAGRSITYTMEVKNLGPADAVDVVVTDRVPENTRYVSGGCVNDEGIVTCNLGRIAAKKSARATFTVAVNASATGTLVSTATVNSPTPDTNQANNSGTDSDTSIVAECDMEATVSVSPMSASAGEKVVYTLTATNGGPSDATNVPLEVTLPEGVTFDSANEGGELKDGKVRWNIDALAAGGRTQREVTAIINEDAPTGDVTAAVDVSFDTDPNPANNSASAALTIQ